MDIQTTEINKKAQAARELKLDITQNYSIVDGNFFVTFEAKKDETIVYQLPIPMNKEQTLQNLEKQKQFFQDNIKQIDENIAKINALGE